MRYTNDQSKQPSLDHDTSAERSEPNAPESRGRVCEPYGRMEEIIAHHTGQPLEAVSKDMERDYFMTAEEAKAYGIIDNVIANRIASP